MESQKIIITGAVGFIGTNVAGALIKNSYSVIAVDYLKEKDDLKRKHLELFPYEKYCDGDDFLDLIKNDALPEVYAIIHLGAITDTSEQDKNLLLEKNTEYSKTLARYCAKKGIRFLYASSAATYGDGSRGYFDTERNLKPLNYYGLSKHLFDEWLVEEKNKPPQWAGFKFFNVYGPHEEHKSAMASVVYKGFHEIMRDGKLRLFKSYREGFKDGEQKRDFVYVGDVVDVILFFLEHSELNGIYNVGTGRARTFLDLADALFAALGKKPLIEFIEMPGVLKEHYQYFTEAEVTKLRNAGYKKEFTSLEEGVKKYVDYLLKENG